jgi:hypothetical protein
MEILSATIDTSITFLPKEHKMNVQYAVTPDTGQEKGQPFTAKVASATQTSVQKTV